MHNPNFNYGKFAIIKSKAGLNSYKISVKEWVEKAKTNGILEIINQNLENVNLLLFIFDAKLVKENIQSDGEEISDIGWFSYEEILNMKNDLRADEYFINTIKNKKENKISPVKLIRIDNN